MAPANTVNIDAQAQAYRIKVKSRLLELDKTVTRLAEELGLARNTVSIAINHPSMLPGVKRRISTHLFSA